MPPNAQNALNPTLLAMLACPSDDHAPLREESFDGADTLVCTYCATRFPVDDGIPVLLLDDATPGPNGVGVAADASSAAGEPAGAVPAVEVAMDEVVAAEPVPPVEPSAGPVAPEAPAPPVADRLPGPPFDARVSPKHALLESVEDTGPVDPPAVGVGGLFDTAEVEDVGEVVEPAKVVDVSETAEVSDTADMSETADVRETAEVVDVADVVEVADVLDADDLAHDHVPPIAAPAQPSTSVEPSTPADPRRPQSPPPGARTLAAALRNRVEHRLAEYEANRGPRRRGNGR